MFECGDMKEALGIGDIDKVSRLVEKACSDGVNAQVILDEGLIGGMRLVGEKMEKGNIFIPEVLMAAKAMNRGVEILKPALNQTGSKRRHRAVIGTVKGDLHDIGKNLVSMMCRSTGMEVIDLGVDVTTDRFMEALEESEADLLCLSALLTTTMPQMKDIVQEVKSNGMAERVRVIVGGAPVTRAYADRIGADGYAADAYGAARLAEEIFA